MENIKGKANHDWMFKTNKGLENLELLFDFWFESNLENEASLAE